MYFIAFQRWNHIKYTHIHIHMSIETFETCKLKWRNYEKETHVLICKRSFSLSPALSFFLSLVRQFVNDDKNINFVYNTLNRRVTNKKNSFVINLHVNQIIDWVQDRSIKLEYINRVGDSSLCQVALWFFFIQLFLSLALFWCVNGFCHTLLHQ